MPGPSTDEAVPGPSATATNLTDKSDVNIKNYIRDVKDVMCDLGDGFIEVILLNTFYSFTR